MSPQLSKEEARFAHDLMAWDRRERSAQWVFCHLLLILGAVVFVAAALFTLRNLDDRTVFWVLLPGSVIAMGFFTGYVVGVRWVRRRHLTATLLDKLCGKN
ncbi:MAG: hypothetical protein V1800_09370 [Candidatus Latescibacterota bacterium]